MSDTIVDQFFSSISQVGVGGDISQVGVGGCEGG